MGDRMAHVCVRHSAACGLSTTTPSRDAGHGRTNVLKLCASTSGAPIAVVGLVARTFSGEHAHRPSLRSRPVATSDSFAAPPKLEDRSRSKTKQKKKRNQACASECGTPPEKLPVPSQNNQQKTQSKVKRTKNYKPVT